MIHPDEGRLRALLDGELAAGEARELRAHAAGCAPCGEALTHAERAQALTTTLLGELDAPAPTERVRARLGELRAARGSALSAPRVRWLTRADLAKAALLVLLFSGAVAAAVHPASPLRHWLDGRSAVTTAAAPNPAESAPTPLAAPAREVGVRVTVSGAGVRIALSGAVPGQTLEVTWVDQGAAAVYAPEGTTFTTSDTDGRIDAALAPGAVRIELPRAAARASLTVDGRPYLEKIGERIDYPGPPALVEGPRVRFEVR